MTTTHQKKKSKLIYAIESDFKRKQIRLDLLAKRSIRLSEQEAAYMVLMLAKSIRDLKQTRIQLQIKMRSALIRRQHKAMFGFDIPKA